MSQPLWQKLKELVVIDKKIHDIHKEIESYKAAMSSFSGDIETLASHLTTLENEIKKRRSSVRLAELRIEELDELEKAKQERLKTARNPKEHKALESELAIVSTERNDQEELLINSWNDVENLEKSLAEKRSEKETTVKDIQEKIQEFAAQCSDLQERESVLERNRSEKTSAIPGDWLSRYENMKHKVTNPLTPVANTSCSSCYYLILKQDLQRLQRGALLHCRSCFRLLYVDERNVDSEPSY